MNFSNLFHSIFNFKIPQKILTISLSFLLPLSVMLYLMFQSISGYIQFATLEEYGNAYQRPLEKLLHCIPQHCRAIKLFSAKDVSRDEKVLNFEAKIDNALMELAMIDDKIGKDLQFTEEGLSKRNRSHFCVKNVKAEWEDLKKNGFTLPLEIAEERHKHLVTDVMAMIAHNGDTSNLILDPDLDSYYLMDSTLITLPQNQMRMAQIIHDGIKVLKDGSLSHEEAERFSLYASYLEEIDLSRVLNNAKTSLNEDQSFYGISSSLQQRLPPAIETYRQAMQSFIDLIKRFKEGEVIDSSLFEDFLSTGIHAREESFSLWNVIADELDVLLERRIAHYENSLFSAVLWAFLSLLVSIGLILLITKSILTPLHKLMAGIKRISAGDLTSQVDVKSSAHDEIAELSRTFNAMVNNLRNVTASREELQKTHEELKHVQLQLLQSEKLASIGQLAAGVAHEINNPLGFISSNVSTLQNYIQKYKKAFQGVDHLKMQIKEEGLEKIQLAAENLNKLEQEINLDFVKKDIEELLKQTSGGLERIQKIVLDLRTFAREEKAETMESIKIEEVIDSILSIIDSQIKYNVDLKKEYGDTPPIQCSVQRLGQVFINLLVNASQAMKEKGVIIIKTYQQDGFVIVDISDTGRGIPEENLKKIFDAFFTTKPIGEGTGLGLSVSYEIVKKHGGEIKVRSKVGEGTTFTVRLPIVLSIN